LDDTNLSQEWKNQVTGSVKDVEPLGNEVFMKDGTAESGSVFKLDTSGEVLWEESVGPSTDQTLAEMNGDVYVGTYSAVKALEDNGDTKWSESVNQILEGGVESWDSSSGDFVVVRYGDGASVLNVSDGTEVSSVSGLGDDIGVGVIASDEDYAYVNDSGEIVQFSNSGVEEKLTGLENNTDMAAGDGYLIRGYLDGLQVFDADSMDVVATLEGELPDGVLPDNIELHDGGVITFTGYESDSQDKKIVYKADLDVERDLVSGYSVVGSGVVGDGLSLSADVAEGVDSVDWDLSYDGGESFVSGNGESIDITDEVWNEFQGMNKAYEEITAEVTVQDGDSTDSYQEDFRVESLDPNPGFDASDSAELSGMDGRVSVEDNDVSFLPGIDDSKAGAVDQVYVEVVDDFGASVVGSEDSVSDYLDQVGEDYTVNIEYRLSQDGSGDWRSVNYTGSLETTPPPVFRGTPPMDLDGDGLYEAVRGKDEFTILDIQTLFNNLENPDLQEYSEAYNFQGGSPDEVTILDVQGQFNKLENS